MSRKNGNVHRQLRALTILDGLIGNAGPRFQRAFADEPLLERLRVVATDSLSNEEVRRKSQQLFRQWAVEYKSTQGMERIVALHQQLPQRKQPAHQEHSKVLKETDSEANEDPFGNSAIIPGSEAPVKSSKLPRDESAISAPASLSPTQNISLLSKPTKHKHDKSGKKARTKFNLEKEKPNLLKNIASASVASITLMNALRSFNREKKKVSEDQELVSHFNECKQLRRQILHYIQHVESEQWLGSLIHANEELVNALMTFEVMDKGVDDDSDSDGNERADYFKPSVPISPRRKSAQGADDYKPSVPTSSRRKSVQEVFAGLTIEKSPNKPSSYPRSSLGKGKAAESEDGDWEDGGGDSDTDNPFADSHAV